jgi:hypothetical protein
MKSACCYLSTLDPANHYEQYPDLFTLCYTIAAKDSGNIHAQAELKRILNRLDAGESPESVVEVAEKKIRARAIETQPDFAALARHISAVLKDPNTPDCIYSALADQVNDMSDGYLGAIHETAPFIEKCLIFEARGEASETTSEVKTDEQQRAELAHLIYSVFNHAALPEILKREFQTAYVTFENASVDIEAISQTPAAIKHALDLASEEKGGNS